MLLVVMVRVGGHPRSSEVIQGRLTGGDGRSGDKCSFCYGDLTSSFWFDELSDSLSPIKNSLNAVLFNLGAICIPTSN